MSTSDRMRYLAERLGDIDPKDYRQGLPPKDTSSLIYRLESHMVRWGAWGDRELGFDGEARPATDAKRSYGLAFKELEAWAKRSKYHRARTQGGLYWVRGADDPVVKLTLEDDDGLQFVRVTLLMYDTPEAKRALGQVGAKRDKILATWEADAYKLMSWLKRLKMRHNVVSVSGLKDKADRFNLDMTDAELQKILGVVGRFATKQGNLRDTVKRQPGEREFAQSIYRSWQSKNREVGVTVRADEYNQKNKDRHGKGFYVTVMLWPAEKYME